MTKEEIVQFVDDYRDGNVTEDDARNVLKVIDEDQESKGLILSELEFSGLISHALDDYSRESFLRSFLERVYAEDNADEFTARIRKETQRIQLPAFNPDERPQDDTVTAAEMVTSQITSEIEEETERAVEEKKKPPKKKPLILAIPAIALIVLFLVFFFLPEKLPIVANMDASSSAVVLRKGQPVEGTKEIRLGDTVEIRNADGATLKDRANNSLTLATKTTAQWAQEEEKTTPVLLLQAGQLEGTIVSAFCLRTAEARVKVNQATLRVKVTASSTLVEVLKGSVDVERLSDRKTASAEEGESLLVTTGAALVPEKMP